MCTFMSNAGPLYSSCTSVRLMRIWLSLAVDGDRCRADAPKWCRIRLEDVLEVRWDELRVLGLPGR